MMSQRPRIGVRADEGRAAPSSSAMNTVPDGHAISPAAQQGDHLRGVGRPGRGGLATSCCRCPWRTSGPDRPS